MERVNLLLDGVPETVEVSGRPYPIETDFRVGILFEKLITDRALDDRSKVATALVLYFGADVPQDKPAALDAVLWFYRRGKEKKKSTETGQKRLDRIYDFEADASYFYAAFLSQYGVDLCETRLHWWKFLAMFEGLRRDCELCRIMEIRAANPAEIKNPKEKRRILLLQEHYRIDAGLSAEEKAEVAGAVFGGML